VKELLTLAAAVLAAFLGAVALFRRAWTTPSRARDRAMDWATLLIALLVVSLVAEGAARTFLVTSDGFEFTKAAKRWREIYWKPVNSLGYRDVEHAPAEARGKRVVFVVGDSFVAGHGVDDYRDRFSDVLARELGPGWIVANIAQDGWDTPHEYRAMLDYPLTPDAGVWSYFINDIEGAAKIAGLKQPAMVEPPPAFLRPLIRFSYTFDYMYYRYHRWRNGPELAATWYRWIDSCFSDSESWRLHVQELHALAEHARATGIPLTVLVIPLPYDVDRTSVYTAKIAGALRDDRVDVVDLTGRLRGRDWTTLVVNRWDPHFGVALHHEVGHLLYEHLRDKLRITGAQAR
jgi:hypothetical protein